MFTTLSILAIVFACLVLFIMIHQATDKWQLGEVIRTPDSAFEDIPDYPFEENYIDCLGYRLHYVDEGPRDGQVVLLLHGQPSWSYLYRHMIPPLLEAGYRVVAPDNVGFGKSDKPIKSSDHSYQMHIDVITDFVNKLDLRETTLFVQDWGGLIGLRVVPNLPHRFARIMLSNTALPAMGGLKGWLAYPLFKFAVWREGKVQKLSSDKTRFSFTRWVAYARHTKHFDLQDLFQSATIRTLDQASLDGYAAPFPNEETMAAIRQFPSMVPSQLRQNQRVIDEFYRQWDKPLITAFGSKDIITAGRDKAFQNIVPGAKGQAHTLIPDAAHFIQDDKPEELTQLLIDFIRKN